MKFKINKKKVKIFLFSVLCVIGVIILVVFSYFIYVFAAYKRLDDLIELDADVRGTTIDTININTPYTIATYNIGFGASDSEFSYFMDGGKGSRAKSEESLKMNMKGIAEEITKLKSDIILLQEVDESGTRTYHFNEIEDLKSRLTYGNYIYAQNYNCPYLIYPFFKPHGSNKSGILTASSFKFEKSLRRSLPIATTSKKFFDLDRCYSVTRISVNNGKYLSIYNLHLSAYGSDSSIREQQLELISEDISLDLKNGNYVICGGDFNHNLRNSTETNVPGWAQPFSRDLLPTNSTFGFEVAKVCDIDHDSCRNLDTPYEKGVTYTVLIDGFIVSNNIEVEYYVSLDWEYERSDHDPVLMRFQLKDEDD